MNPLTLEPTRQFKRDFKRCEKRHFDLSKLEDIINKLAQRQPLEAKYKDHALKGDWEPARECHIENDWLLVYFVEDDILHLVRTGTHSYLGI